VKNSNQIEAQRSGFDLKRKNSEMSELSALDGSEDMELVLTKRAMPQGSLYTFFEERRKPI